jgi:DNA-binding transcriptional regulator YhcF (GntR family)
MGVNTMTVNKGYQILKTEGFIEIDRRYGARISETVPENQEFKEKLETQLELLAAEAKVRGMEQEELEELCKNIFKQFRLA